MSSRLGICFPWAGFFCDRDPALEHVIGSKPELAIGSKHEAGETRQGKNIR
jgi:hypothetical protein